MLYVIYLVFWYTEIELNFYFVFHNMSFRLISYVVIKWCWLIFVLQPYVTFCFILGKLISKLLIK